MYPPTLLHPRDEIGQGLAVNEQVPRSPGDGRKNFMVSMQLFSEVATRILCHTQVGQVSIPGGCIAALIGPEEHRVE